MALSKEDENWVIAKRAAEAIEATKKADLIVAEVALKEVEARYYAENQAAQEAANRALNDVNAAYAAELAAKRAAVETAKNALTAVAVAKEAEL